MTLEVDNNHNHILNGGLEETSQRSKEAMTTLNSSTQPQINLDASFDAATEPRKRTNSSEMLNSAVEISRIHSKTDEFIKEIMAKTDQFKAEVETLLSKSRSEADQSPGAPAGHHKKSRTDGHLREKVFEHRESILTELFKISHIRTFRHVFISLLIIICFQILVFDYTNQGKLNLDFELLNWSFSGFSETMLYCWLPMQLFALYVVYYMFKAWAYARNKLNGKSDSVSYFFIALYALYILMLIYLPLYMVQRVSVACRLIILIEQVRLLMKSHAFVRTNIPKVQSYGETVEKNDSHKVKSDSYGCPEFSKYLYFMFAPTLVYRDNYPRTKSTNWGLVLTYFAEIIGSIIYTYCLFDRFCVPVFREVRVKQLTIKSYIYLISISILPGALMQLMVFFSLLHSWHNAFAEMLRFGDRQFYLDWWNSTSYNAYYRTWNTLVHDWLYAYIYQDLYRLFGKNYRALCQFGVIFISSVFHEHILSFAFGFFYPVLFFLFSVFGFVCLFIPRGNSAPWNVFIWTSLFTGIGIQLCLFSIEWYARRSDECPRIFTSFIDYILPRSIFCLENFF